VKKDQLKLALTSCYRSLSKRIVGNIDEKNREIEIAAREVKKGNMNAKHWPFPANPTAQPTTATQDHPPNFSPTPLPGSSANHPPMIYPFIRLNPIALRVTLACCGALCGARMRGEIMERME
jgi:hypothetical protein